ncbi:MAG: cupin domain-containing protein [Paludibacteraceae bacterium]|nr:cupin domain-containing protein [Paludibacteraceae bacterium]
MKKLILFSLIAFAFLGCKVNLKENQKEISAVDTIQIFPRGELITHENFKGKAWLKTLVTDKENFDLTVSNVEFESSARNNWHSHPGGQILIGIKGNGYYQEKEKPIQLIKVGDVIEILPNVVHWHGASPEGTFEHLAISAQQSKGTTVWLESVTDEEYNSFIK